MPFPNLPITSFSRAFCVGNRTSFPFSFGIAMQVEIIVWFNFDQAISPMIVSSWDASANNYSWSLSPMATNSNCSSRVLVGPSNFPLVTPCLNCHSDRSPNLFFVLNSPTLEHLEILRHPRLGYTKTLISIKLQFCNCQFRLIVLNQNALNRNALN